MRSNAFAASAYWFWSSFSFATFAWAKALPPKRRRESVIRHIGRLPCAILQHFRTQLSRFVAQFRSAFELEFLGRFAHFGFEFCDDFGKLFRIVRGDLFGFFLG